MPKTKIPAASGTPRARKPGPATRRDNGKPSGRAGTDRGRNLLNRTRAQHGARGAAIGSAPIHRIGGDIGILNEAILRPHNGGEQFGWRHKANTSSVKRSGQTGSLTAQIMGFKHGAEAGKG